METRQERALLKIVESAAALRADAMASESLALELGSIVAHAEEALAVIDSERNEKRLAAMRASGPVVEL